MLNKIILIGRLTREPELNYTQNGVAVCKFTLACNRKFNKGEADFIDCVAWRGLAENVANYLGKGSLAAVEGRLQTRTYETKEGQKRKASEVICDDVRFLDSKGKGKSQQQDTSGWEDLGREVSLENIGEDVPF